MSSFICMRIFHLDEPVQHSVKCFLGIVGRVLDSPKAVPGVGWMGPIDPLILQVPDKNQCKIPTLNENNTAVLILMTM